jgi:hypothetical protein
MRAITPENGDNKISLKMKEVKRYEVDYSDLSDFVTEVYGIAKDSLGRGYNFAATEECGNDVSIPFNVEPEPFNPKWDDVEQFKEKGFGISNYSIMNDLCHKGWIPAGSYIVHVCW